MTILGIDYGERKIGLAKSAGNLAVPLCIIENDKNLFQKIKDICEKEEIEKIVVGVPYTHGSKKNQQIKKIESFINKLKRYMKMEIVSEDERLSTLQAQKLWRGLGKEKDDDAVSAMLILQSYLDKQR